MAASNFLQLTNRVLNAFNEVELTSVSFPNTIGFHTEVKNAVNQGLFDAYSYKGVKWPFLYSVQSFTATRGVYKYPVTTPNPDIDWESFRSLRESYTLTSITQTAGTATATTSVPHTLKTGDLLYIDGAVETGYNSDSAPIIVTGANTFTYTVATTTPSPATTTSLLTAKSNTVIWKRLYPIDINEYELSYGGINENQTSTSFNYPEGVAREQDNSIILFPAPDRTYIINYTAFVVPSGLVNAMDTHLIPEKYEQVIIDFAMHYAYMFRDNSDEAMAATKRAEERVNRMAKDLIPIQTNVNFDGASC